MYTLLDARSRSQIIKKHLAHKIEVVQNSKHNNYLTMLEPRYLVLLMYVLFLTSLGLFR